MKVLRVWPLKALKVQFTCASLTDVTHSLCVVTSRIRILRSREFVILRFLLRSSVDPIDLINNLASFSFSEY